MWISFKMLALPPLQTSTCLGRTDIPAYGQTHLQRMCDEPAVTDFNSTDEHGRTVTKEHTGVRPSGRKKQNKDALHASVYVLVEQVHCASPSLQ